MLFYWRNLWEVDVRWDLVISSCYLMPLMLTTLLRSQGWRPCLNHRVIRRFMFKSIDIILDGISEYNAQRKNKLYKQSKLYNTYLHLTQFSSYFFFASYSYVGCMKMNFQWIKLVSYHPWRKGKQKTLNWKKGLFRDSVILFL